MNIDKLEPGKQVVWSCYGDDPEWTGTILTWNIAREGDARGQMRLEEEPAIHPDV